MLDMRFGRLTSRVFVVAAGRLAIPGAALVTNMYLARILPKTAVGQIQEVYVHLQIILNIAAVGIQTSLYNFLPRLPLGQQRRLVGQSLGILGALGAAALALALAGAPRLAEWLGNPSAAGLIRAGAVALAVSLLATISDPLFLCHGRADLSALSTVLGTVTQVGVVVLCLRGEHQLSIFFWAITLGQSVRLLWGLGFAVRRLPHQFADPGRSALLWEQLVFVLPVTLTSVVDSLSSYLDRLLVAHLFDAASMALYTNGAIELPFIGVLIGAILPVLLPHLAEQLAAGRKEEAHAVWGRAVRKVALILVGLFWLFLWIAEDFVVLLFSERYRESARFFRIYLLLLPLRSIAFMPVLYALGQARVVLVGAVADLVLNLAFSLAFILWAGWGMAGAAWGTVVATMIQALFYLESIRRAMNLPWSRLLPWRTLFGDCLVAALWMLPLGGTLVLETPAWLRLVLAALLAATYGLAVVLPRLRAPEHEQNRSKLGA